MDDPENSNLQISSKSALLLFLACIAASLVLTAIKQSPGELAVYLRAEGRFTDGQEIYRPTDFGPFTYPPFFVLPLRERFP